MGLFRKGNNVQYTPLRLVKHAVQVIIYYDNIYYVYITNESDLFNTLG